MNIPANLLHLYPKERERRERAEKAMDALSVAQRAADHEDWEVWDDGEPTEVCLQTFASITWDTGEYINGGDYRFAVADIIGARLGKILLDRDTLDAAFPGQVDKTEERLSEEYTAKGEDW